MARGTGTMRTGATSRPSAGTSKKLSGSNEIKPFRDNESSDPYYDPQWDNPYQREVTPSNEDPKRKADRERQQRIDEKDWDSLTKKKKQEDFNLDLTGSVGFSHEIANIGGSSIAFTAGIDFLPGPDLKIKDGKATVGVGVGLSRIHSVSGGLVIDLETKEVTGISGGLAAFGLGIEFSAEKCHTTVTITIGGIGITYGQDTCKKEDDKTKPEPKREEKPPRKTEPDPSEPTGVTPTPGSGSPIGIPPNIPDGQIGYFLFCGKVGNTKFYENGEASYSDVNPWGYKVIAPDIVELSIRYWGIDVRRDSRGNLVPSSQNNIYTYRFDKTTRLASNTSQLVTRNINLFQDEPNRSLSILTDAPGFSSYIMALIGTRQQIETIWENTELIKISYKASSRELVAMGVHWGIASSHCVAQGRTELVFVGFVPIPIETPQIFYPNPIITPEKNIMCDLSPVMSLQRQNNEMLKQNTEITNQAAAAIGVGAFPATYPGSLTTNAGTKKVNNLAEQVDTIYDTIDELLGKYPQKHKVKKKNKDGKDEELDIEIPNQSEGQAELLGMMMQSLQQTSASNNMENRQLQELALTRQMVIKLYYMVESIMEYLDYPTETTVVNVPMSITPMKRKGRNIEKLKEFGEMVKESVQPVIVTKKKSGDPETLKKYLLHLSHGAAVIKAAFWRKLSPENPKEQINANLAQQEKLSELSSTEKAWNEALDSMASKLDPTNSEAKKNAPKIEVEKKKPGEK